MSARARSRRGRRAERGFTLLELLITMVVTVFGLMGIMAAHVAATRGNATAGQTQEAVAIGTQALEYLRSKRTPDMVQALTGSPSAALPIAVSSYETKLGRNGLSYEVGVAVTEVSASLWRIRVEVRWLEDGSTVPRMIPIEVVRSTQEAM